MPSCDILDFKCIIVNELFGSIVLTVIGLLIMYFLVSGKLKFGAELTLALAFPVIIIISLFIGGFSVVYAFATIVVALMAAYIFQRIIGNR